MKLLFIELFFPGSLVLDLESKRLPSHNKAWNTRAVAPCLFALCMKLNFFPRVIELSDFCFAFVVWLICHIRDFFCAESIFYCGLFYSPCNF